LLEEFISIKAGKSDSNREDVINEIKAHPNGKGT
jgi:hypothetical protein